MNNVETSIDVPTSQVVFSPDGVIVGGVAFTITAVVSSHSACFEFNVGSVVVALIQIRSAYKLVWYGITKLFNSVWPLVISKSIFGSQIWPTVARQYFKFVISYDELTLTYNIH